MLSLQRIGLFVISYFIIPRLTFLPKSVHTLLIIFGPFLLPRCLDLFNTLRATSRSVPVRPVPRNVQRALNLLFVATIAWIVLSLPHFAPENIFMETQSRLQIEPNTLFMRLRMLRPLTPEDEILKNKFTERATNKLLYLTFGPDALINCIWCTNRDGDDTENYLLYSLPSIVTPHIFHLGVLGLATSSLVGSEGSRFRIHVAAVGLFLAVVEIWFLATYDIKSNKKAKTLQEVEFVHWRLPVLRYICFALMDAVLALVLWLTSTNRWLAVPPTIAERLELSTREAEDTTNKLRALGLITNSVNRSPTLRVVKDAYWRTEGDFVSETVQDADVTEQINKAMSKLDLPTIEGQVDDVADKILKGIDGLRATDSPPVS